MTREGRAIEVRRRAWEFVNARGATVAEGLLQYVSVGMTIEDLAIADTLIATKAGKKVIVVEWGKSGKFRLLGYASGLWETQLKHLTRGAL